MSWGTTYTEIDGQTVNLRAPFSYEMSEKVMQTGRRGRRKLQNHTYLERIDEHTVGVRLHDTYVVKLHDDGSTSLDSGGWHTMTTKDRINAYLMDNFAVSSDRGRWYVYDVSEDRDDPQDDYRGGVYYPPKWTKVHRFFDGIRLAADGTIMNPRRAEMEALDKRERDLEKRMAKYVKGFLRALRDGIPMPGPGDCWGCTSGGAMGDSHLLDHFDEDYYVPSLLVNAYRDRGYGDWRFPFSADMDYGWLEAEKGIRLRRKGTYVQGEGMVYGEEPDTSPSFVSGIGRNLRRYLKPRVLKEVQR